MANENIVLFGTGGRRLKHNARKFLREKTVIEGHDRSLQSSSSTKDIECASAQEIRDYLKDKTVIVYSTQSFVEENLESGRNELVHYLEPVAEKRLDFKFHKRMEAVF